jgi:hypothetical protein
MYTSEAKHQVPFHGVKEKPFLADFHFSQKFRSTKYVSLVVPRVDLIYGTGTRSIGSFKSIFPNTRTGIEFS